MTTDWRVHWTNGSSSLDRFVLASASPRRRDLLAALGVPVVIVPPGVVEDALPNERPDDMAERLARAKVEAVADGDPAHVVVGADTIVVVDDVILGKPRDPAEAALMLGRLSGRTHHVVTGIAAMRGGHLRSGVERTAVTFRPLSEREITAYVATPEPHDKAGAYAAQGRGSVFIARVDGCFYNVIGLPIVRLRSLVCELEGVGT